MVCYFVRAVEKGSRCILFLLVALRVSEREVGEKKVFAHFIVKYFAYMRALLGNYVSGQPASVWDDIAQQWGAYGSVSDKGQHRRRQTVIDFLAWNSLVL